MKSLLRYVGQGAIEIASDIGGMTLVLLRVLVRLIPWRCDRDELLRAMVHFGIASLPIIAATAIFTGLIMAVQSAAYVQQYGVYDLMGWFVGFTTFREVGPVLIGLIFSGRVGANHTSELATMRVTEQLDALRLLALDPYELIILPRTVTMVLGLAALLIFGDLIAVCSGAMGARLLSDVSFTQYANSFLQQVTAGDFLTGVVKAAMFGGAIAVVSTHFGLTAKGGSSGVGRAVNAQVVASATSLFVLDYFMTSMVSRLSSWNMF